MQREISNKVFFGQTVSLYDDHLMIISGRSSALDRTASNYDDGKEKLKKLGTAQYSKI